MGGLRACAVARHVWLWCALGHHTWRARASARAFFPLSKSTLPVLGTVSGARLVISVLAIVSGCIWVHGELGSNSQQPLTVSRMADDYHST